MRKNIVEARGKTGESAFLQPQFPVIQTLCVERTGSHLFAIRCVEKAINSRHQKPRHGSCEIHNQFSKYSFQEPPGAKYGTRLLNLKSQSFLLLFFYHFFIRLYAFGMWAAAFVHPKAALWWEGRARWRQRYREKLPRKHKKRLWIHAASLGEFEQGRAVIEDFRRTFPDAEVILSFFSPSGYELRKHYDHAHAVFYLPLDTPANARDFIEIVQPDLTIFIKYEFWYCYLRELKRRRLPVLLISAAFRPEQPFFRPWGGLWRDMLSAFTHFFVQDETSRALLQQIGYAGITVAGDTRIDRVLRLAAAAPANDIAAAFAVEADVLVAGSTWPADEVILLPAFQRLWQQATAPDTPFKRRIKILIAPHEPAPAYVERLLRTPALRSLRYSAATPATAAAADLLVIDNIGMLNTLYRYGHIAYIGGGFGKGIHNTLEPAAYGVPVLFGPRYQKFGEARAFVACGAAFSVEREDDLLHTLERLWPPVAHRKASEAILNYLHTGQGATQSILAYIARNNLFP